MKRMVRSRPASVGGYRDNELWRGIKCATAQFADVGTKTFSLAVSPRPFGRPLLSRRSRSSPHRQRLRKSSPGPGSPLRCRPATRSPAQTAWRSMRPVGRLRHPSELFLRLTFFSNAVFAAGAFVPANTGGRIALNDGTINNTTTAGGTGAQGVIAQTGGLITGTNVNINGSGFASTALAAEGGQIIWNGGAIMMTGNTASGVITAWELLGSGGTVTVNGTTFPNPVSQGVELGGGGTVTLNGVNMTTTSFGVFAHQAFSPAPNTFTMNGGSLTAVLPFDAGLGGPGTASLATFNVNDAVVTATGGRFPLFDVVN